MKLKNYFRQLKKILVFRKQLHLQKITTNLYSYEYFYTNKIFINFLVFGLFKNPFSISFGSDYLKHLSKYIFKDLPNYCKDFIDYHFSMFYHNKIKHEHVQYIPPLKPLSAKIRATHKCVEEHTLYKLAEKLGFKIVNEKLNSIKSVYTLKFISD